MKNIFSAGKIAVLTAFVMLLGVFCVFSANADDVFVITSREIGEVKKDITIGGTLPSVFIEEYSALEERLNRAIENEYENVLKKINIKKGEVVFSFDEYYFENYVSLMINCWNEESLEAVGSVCFDSESFSIVNINDVLGLNGVKMLNKALAGEIKSDLDKYNANFSGIDKYHTFYADDGVINIVFDKYEIANGREGIVYFPFDTENVTEEILLKEEYKTKADYNVRMVMLKQIATIFDMALEWDEKTSTVSVILNEQQSIVKITIGDNSYSKSSSSTKILLEAAPEIIDNRTYVPISFLESILDISYNVNSDGSITLSKYEE